PAAASCPLPHPDDAMTSCAVLGGARSGHDDGAATVVEYLDDDPAPVGAEPHLAVGTGTGVLEHVGERLLDDAVGEQVNPGRKLARDPIGGQRDGPTRPADLLDEPGEIRQAGLRAQSVEVGLRSEDPEQ